jgi:hypothetical protein
MNYLHMNWVQYPHNLLIFEGEYIMSRVARAARVASRQRTEALTASKTIATAETGELYLLDAKSLTITLPDAQEGAYFTFIVGSKHTLHTAATLVTIQTSGETLEGSGTYMKNGDTNVRAIHSTSASHTLIKVTSATAGSSDKLFPGSKFEFWSDGTNWYVHAAIFVGGDALIAFA